MTPQKKKGGGGQEINTKYVQYIYTHSLLIYLFIYSFIYKEFAIGGKLNIIFKKIGIHFRCT